MKKTSLRTIQLLVLSLSLIAICSCGGKDESTLTLTLFGLDNLGDNYKYEVWIVVDGKMQSGGKFDVDSEGNTFPSSFDIEQREVQKATTCIVTIEPNPDLEPSSSNLNLLSGDFNGSTAALSILHDSAFGIDFSSAAGSYILATPTDNDNSNELSGIWFTSRDSIDGISLNLPPLPPNWIYEGWSIINEVPLSMGTFNRVDSNDNSAFYSSSLMGFNFPGEDFLLNAPLGLTFPTDLSNSELIVDIKPITYEASEPFLLQILAATIDSSAQDSTTYALINNSLSSFPMGTAIR